MIETLQELENIYLEIKLEGKTGSQMVHMILSKDLYDYINELHNSITWKEGRYPVMFNSRYKNLLFHVGE